MVAAESFFASTQATVQYSISLTSTTTFGDKRSYVLVRDEKPTTTKDWRKLEI
jgi:hypothetical protein